MGGRGRGANPANPANLFLRSVARRAPRCCPPQGILARKDPCFYGVIANAQTAQPEAPKPHTRENSKQAQVIAMLRRPEGATLAQICACTGGQQHTVRGTFAGAFKKKLGLTLTSTKDAVALRVYFPV